jgi:hypothetical protein
MDLGPRLDQPLLGAWKLATNAFNWVHRKRRQGVLVESVKMWPVMRCTHLRKHTDDDSEERRNFWHSMRFHLDIGFAG